MDVLTHHQQNLLQELKKMDVFRLAVKNAYNEIIITDTEGKILYANQATQRITGYAQSEIIGHTPRLWGGQMPKVFYEKLWKTIKEERNPFMSEVINRRKNGERYRARLTISPITREDGMLLGFVGVEEEVSGGVSHS